eukprot:g9904.t1
MAGGQDQPCQSVRSRCVLGFLLLASAAGAVSNEQRLIQGLHRKYHEIFRHGNRNAASHLWAAHILDKSRTYTDHELQTLFSGFCPVSGSPVNPHPSGYNRVARFGYLHYCCWPCVCDTQDFIRVDTKTVVTKNSGASGKQYWFTVIGNPCTMAIYSTSLSSRFKYKLREPFHDPFERRAGMQTLEMVAPEVRCKDGELLGAPISDHGYVIIGLFADSEPAEDLPERYMVEGGPANYHPVVVAERGGGAAQIAVPQPGRMSVDRSGKYYQAELEFDLMCRERADHGYNSGMGEIFRKVSGIAPVTCSALPAPEERLQLLPAGRAAGENTTGEGAAGAAAGISDVSDPPGATAPVVSVSSYGRDRTGDL